MDDIEQTAAHVRARPFVWFIRIVLSGLLLLILATLVGGILAVAWELRRLFADDVELVLRHVLIGILILLAVVEVFKTSLAWKSFALLLAVIGALGGVRVLAVRFSPSAQPPVAEPAAAPEA